MTEISAEVLQERMAHVLERVEDLCDRFDALDREVRALQRWRAYLIGAWAVLAIAGGTAITLIKFIE